MSSMVSVSENGKLVHKRQSSDKEASSGHQQFSGDQGSSRKHIKSRTTHRISDLPDGVLQNILSYLPAPEVVRTSILSPRWRELWTAVPCLQVDKENEFEYDEFKFMDFVSCVLNGRSDQAPLEVLNIYPTYFDDDEYWIRYANVDYWIHYAINHNVESLRFYDQIANEPFVLDTSISFSSSHLKILVLSNVSLAATHLSQLDDLCPNLQILCLRYAHLDTFGISSSSLTRLCIRDCSTPGDMMISAPNLTLLRFINSGNEVVSLEKLPLLEEASVVLYFDIDSADDVTWEIVEDCKYSILRGLSHAKSLELDVPIREPLVSWKELLGSNLFSNLTTLFLGEWCMADSYPVSWFLQQAPLLENIHVRLRPMKSMVMDYEPRTFPNARPLRAACLNNATIISIRANPLIQELVNLFRSAAKSSLMINVKSG